MSKRPTIIKYQDTALPLANTAVTLFNSATAFPPGKCFHLLGMNYFQYLLSYATAAGGEAGTVTGSFSNDGGVTWVDFYTKAVNAANDPAVVTSDDEVVVSMFQDIRFQFTQATNNSTIFSAHLCLNPDKSSSKAATTDVLI